MAPTCSTRTSTTTGSISTSGVSGAAECQSRSTSPKAHGVASISARPPNSLAQRSWPRRDDVSETPALRAYAVTEEDEGTGGIIFARHAIVARRAGANEYNGGEFHGVT